MCIRDRAVSRSVLVDLRNVVTQLHPASPTTDGLATALGELADTTRRRTGIDVSVSCPHGLDDLDAALAEDVYFIAAEAIHNAVKHAGASQVTVEVAGGVATTAIELVVADDGRGFDRMPERWDGGYGLTSMQARADRWGGSLTVRSGRADGTRVAFVLPQTPGAPGRSERTP